MLSCKVLYDVVELQQLWSSHRSQSKGALHSLEVAASAGPSLVVFTCTELGLLSVLYFGKLVSVIQELRAWSFLSNAQRHWGILEGEKSGLSPGELRQQN